MKTKDWNGQVALVTGASSGIGAATARKLAEKGISVIITARRAERLNTLAAEIRAAGGMVTSIPSDLSDPSKRQEFFTSAEAVYGKIDILVNNAGFGWYGYMSEMTWETAYDLIQVNIAAATQLSLLALAGMKRSGYGHIINVGSIAGALPNQGIAVYSASKAYLNAFTTAIHRELTGSAIHFGILLPGAVKTEFFTSIEKRPFGRRLNMDWVAITSKQVAGGVWFMLNHPRRKLYLPWWVAVSPWVELLFGGVIDLLGPMLLKSGH
ncbi:MAG TPA: SDR family NAD(P)-dependent oxidoreductase [Longilinea sp.]|nr:SDR family NAD(P)-dependent oxidoreductase [Longilinea sp.]